MTRWLSGMVGALVEAWQEVRIHKTRVMMSLIGVAVAVCAITTVVGLGGVANQALIEQYESQSGRPANLQLNASLADGTPPSPEVMNAAWATATERYDISFSTRVINSSQLVQFADGALNVPTTGVDEAYATMHRIRLTDGDWFSSADSERLAPAVIVSDVFYDRLGRPDLAAHPTTTLIGQQNTTAVVIGVFPTSEWETQPRLYMLVDALQALPPAVPTSSAGGGGGMAQAFGGGSFEYNPNAQPPMYEVWVPPEVAEEMTTALERDVQGALGKDASVSVYRNDYGSWGMGDPLLPMKIMVGGVAGLVLLLGALGLVNIAMVTLKQRIREIGIRRSFGATAGRVFFSVMMESVAATVVAGLFGVIGAVLIVKNPWVEGLIGQGMVTDFPPFPVEAAILGLVASTVVGALAGLLPALVAVRVKVIDAIRY